MNRYSMTNAIPMSHRSNLQPMRVSCRVVLSTIVVALLVSPLVPVKASFPSDGYEQIALTINSFQKKKRRRVVRRRRRPRKKAPKAKPKAGSSKPKATPQARSEFKRIARSLSLGVLDGLDVVSSERPYQYAKVTAEHARFLKTLKRLENATDPRVRKVATRAYIVFKAFLALEAKYLSGPGIVPAVTRIAARAALRMAAANVQKEQRALWTQLLPVAKELGARPTRKAAPLDVTYTTRLLVKDMTHRYLITNRSRRNFADCTLRIHSTDFLGRELTNIYFVETWKAGQQLSLSAGIGKSIRDTLKIEVSLWSPTVSYEGFTKDYSASAARIAEANISYVPGKIQAQAYKEAIHLAKTIRKYLGPKSKHDALLKSYIQQAEDGIKRQEATAKGRQEILDLLKKKKQFSGRWSFPRASGKLTLRFDTVHGKARTYGTITGVMYSPRRKKDAKKFRGRIDGSNQLILTFDIRSGIRLPLRGIAAIKHPLRYGETRRITLTLKKGSFTGKDSSMVSYSFR